MKMVIGASVDTIFDERSGRDVKKRQYEAKLTDAGSSSGRAVPHQSPHRSEGMNKQDL